MQQGLVHDPWLSEIIARPAYQLRLAGPELPRALAEETQATLARPSFVSVKVATDAIGTVHALEDLGFRVTDNQLVLERDTAIEASANAQVVTRAARPDDERAVGDIARTTFRFSRFHLDPKVPRSIADQVKAAWVLNYFRGKRGDALVVAERDGVVCGFNQLLLQDHGETLLIDLIGVARSHQGHGVASAMIRFAPGQGRGAQRYRVATQAANIPSLRLYEKLGFRVAQSQYVLHAHGR